MPSTLVSDTRIYEYRGGNLRQALRQASGRAGPRRSDVLTLTEIARRADIATYRPVASFFDGSANTSRSVLEAIMKVFGVNLYCRGTIVPGMPATSKPKGFASGDIMEAILHSSQQHHNSWTETCRLAAIDFRDASKIRLREKDIRLHAIQKFMNVLSIKAVF